MKARILKNHGKSKAVGFVTEENGKFLVNFTQDVSIADEWFFDIFGIGGVEFGDAEVVDGLRIIKAGRVLEFSL